MIQIIDPLSYPGTLWVRRGVARSAGVRVLSGEDHSPKRNLLSRIPGEEAFMFS
jgi:hypothetical protein